MSINQASYWKHNQQIKWPADHTLASDCNLRAWKDTVIRASRKTSKDKTKFKERTLLFKWYKRFLKPFRWQKNSKPNIRTNIKCHEHAVKDTTNQTNKPIIYKKVTDKRVFSETLKPRHDSTVYCDAAYLLSLKSLLVLRQNWMSSR